MCDGVERLHEVDCSSPHFDSPLVASLINHSVFRSRRLRRSLLGWSKKKTCPISNRIDGVECSHLRRVCHLFKKSMCLRCSWHHSVLQSSAGARTPSLMIRLALWSFPLLLSSLPTNLGLVSLQYHILTFIIS